MKYKLAPHVTDEMLKEVGFTYRSWYDNYNFLVSCPNMEKTLKRVISLGYSQEDALQTDEVKRTFMDYYIQIDKKNGKIDIYTHALKNFPYEVLQEQHDISHDIIAKMYDLIDKGYVVVVSK